MVFLKNHDKYHYNSFIFGSSRSCSFTSATWQQYLPPDNKPFSFGAWNENVTNIYKRLRLIDSVGSAINNVFILLDVDKAFTYNGDINADHYLIRGISKYEYYKQDYINYLQTPSLFITSVDYLIFHKRRAYMKGFIGMKKSDLDTINNDWFPNSEKTIEADSAGYYKGTANKFYIRTQTQQYAKQQIDYQQESVLLKICNLLKKHHTNYKIVISPLYDQVKLNPRDLAILKIIFGGSNVFDYSGINKITGYKYNYGNDVIHFRKKVGARIYQEIYK